MVTAQASRRRRRKAIILATLLTSLASINLVIVSIATDSWVTGKAVDEANTNLLGYSVEANYGLFSGSMTSGPSSPKDTNDLTVVCDSGEGVCMMGCESVGEAKREQVLMALVHCSNVTLFGPCELSLTPGSLDCVDQIALGTPVANQQQANYDSREGTTRASVPDRDFINAGLRLAVIVFCGFALFVSVICSGLSLLNTVRDPSTTLLSTFGLRFVFNPCAAALYLLILILWGSLHASVLSGNLMVPLTLAGTYPDNDVSLGYSYWLVFVAMFLHAANVVLLFLSDRPEKLAVRQTGEEDRKEAVNTMIY